MHLRITQAGTFFGTLGVHGVLKKLTDDSKYKLTVDRCPLFGTTAWAFEKIQLPFIINYSLLIINYFQAWAFEKV